MINIVTNYINVRMTVCSEIYTLSVMYRNNMHIPSNA